MNTDFNYSSVASLIQAAEKNNLPVSALVLSQHHLPEVPVRSHSGVSVIFCNSGDNHPLLMEKILFLP